MEYLLDTSTCSLLIAHVPQVITHLNSLSDVDNYIFTCTIVRGEILFGIQRLPAGRRRQVLENQTTSLFEALPCHPIPKEAADNYATMKSFAEQQGTPLSENDLWIGATAMTFNAVLVTADSDYQRISNFGLQIEDWSN